MTPTPEEGGPTLREIKSQLMYIKHCCELCDRRAKLIISKLSDEALERDEKRTAALEELENRVRYLADIIPGCDGEELNEWARTFANSVKDKLDALSPTQEKQ